MKTSQEKIILLILAFINFTHIIDFMIMMPLAPQLIPFFNINPQQFGYLVSSYTISAGISGFLMAFFVDRLNRKTTLLMGYIGFIVGTIACGLAPTYDLLLLARIVAGTFGGLIGAQVLSIVGDVVPFERRGQAMGIVMLAFSMASIVGVPFGLYVANALSWHAPFLIVGGVGMLIIPAIYLFLPNLNTHIQKGAKFSPMSVIAPILTNYNQQIGILMMVLLITGHFLVIPFLSPYMVSNVGFTKETLPLIYLFGGVVTLFSSPIVGKFSDKYGKFKVLYFGIIASMLPILLITHLQQTPLYVALMISCIFFIFTGARIIPAQAIITSLVPAQQRGSYMSISSSLQQLAMGIAAFVAGSIIIEGEDKKLLNYNYVGYLSVLVSLVAMFVAYLLSKQQTKNSTE